MDDAFRSATPEDEVLFELVVTKGWLRQVIVGLARICRSSCRGVMEFLRDLLGVSMSVGSVHDVLRSAAEKAAVVNREQDLSAIRVGLHDELFQGALPVLAGVCAQSTYCYLLVAAQHRDADTCSPALPGWQGEWSSQVLKGLQLSSIVEYIVRRI